MTRWIACAVAVWSTALVVGAGQGRHPYAGTLDQHPAIDYRGIPPTDTVTTLSRELSSGAATLAFDGREGFLRALLARLDVPVESQVLLFSKTGIQHPFTDTRAPEEAVNETTLNRLVLDARVDAAAYPVATSDIAALLVFDHQGRAMNLLTRLGWEARIAGGEVTLADNREWRELVNETADYLLFVDEAPLPAPVTGGMGFARACRATGPRDRAGRSLREFDLKTRLFRYRCSYMIYSPAFDALPVAARDAFYARMRQTLTNRNDRDVLDILDDTRKGWR